MASRSCDRVGPGSADTDYLVVVPRDLAVRAESRSGDVKAADLPQGVELRSNSGSLELTSVGGEVRLKTSSGSVDGEKLGDGRYTVDAGSSSGDSESSIKQDPAADRVIRARSSSGDVDLEYADR